ncbi:TraB/GumN family protein [Uliginosibacterium aquaticum]|uniref:TraB/GumN family protein n=1 Tax=Uliginosibacterium aquaticum TaxID=2731212 RepID=A0ABX2IIV8_9RHOO|nr:TraB/GumN family protein [Uliginosibacterium aquaticum]NSL56764.1 TraB/GumN family protein [Uliginosibacterium aquaticum]
MYRIVAVLGLMVGLLGSPFALASERLMLWEASSAKGTVYLFGSIHVCKASCFPLSASVTRRLDASDALVLELDPARSEAQLGLLTAGMYPAGDSLQRKMSAGQWQVLERSLEKLGLPAPMMAGFRPWMLSLTITLQAAQQAGFDVSQGIDLWALERARAQGKKVLELESVERQIAAASAGSEHEQLEALQLLLQQVNAGRLPGMFEEMRQAWQRGDTSALERLTAEGAPKGSSITYELLDRRNAEMADKLQKQFLPASRKLFVVVGAAHLVGPKGVPALLAQQGFKLRQLSDGD